MLQLVNNIPTLVNTNIVSEKKLTSPEEVIKDHSITPKIAETVMAGRREIVDILHGRDNRLLVIAGPCSVHSEEDALAYAQLLAEQRHRYADTMAIIMRVYFEKPRTTVGWKGAIVDPDLNDSFDIEKGRRLARKVLLAVNDMGLPTATEFLDPVTPQYIGDLVSWAAIGARTTESQTHREMASGLSMPVGFKNGTGGSVDIAINGMQSAASAHHFVGINAQGESVQLKTAGNPDTHLILRGGAGAANHDADSVATAVAKLEAAGVCPNIIVDCSHANGKQLGQHVVCMDVVRQRSSNSHIAGIMLESFLEEGRQDVSDTPLVPGKSITDPCISWEQTAALLAEIHAAH